MSVLLNGPVSLPVTAGRILLAGDETSVLAIRTIVQMLPESARGQIFIEVSRAADIQMVETPELVTVTWLARESRSGNPGTSESCQPGQALDRAVRAWVSEMNTGNGEVDGGELIAWIDGDSVLLNDLRSDLTARLGSSTDTGTFVR